MSDPFFILAPMDDVTDTVFRRIVASCAAPDLFFTEFANVDGLQSPGRPRLLPKLRLEDESTPVVAQLWGKKPQNYYTTAKEAVAMGFAGIDINFGCPDKTIVKNECCSAMIKPDNRSAALDIVHAVQDAVGGIVPVSVKTRLGFNDVDFTWHRALLETKLEMLTVHARTRKEMSKVDAHWDLLREVVRLRDEVAPETKIVGNGDVRDRSHGKELAVAYGVDGIMIGRGVFKDPFCFAAESPWGKYTKKQKIDLFAKHVILFNNTWKNGERRFETLRKFAKIYISDFEGASELRDAVMHCEDAERLLAVLSQHAA